MTTGTVAPVAHVRQACSQARIGHLTLDVKVARRRTAPSSSGRRQTVAVSPDDELVDFDPSVKSVSRELGKEEPDTRGEVNRISIAVVAVERSEVG